MIKTLLVILPFFALSAHAQLKKVNVSSLVYCAEGNSTESAQNGMNNTLLKNEVTVRGYADDEILMTISKPFKVSAPSIGLSMDSWQKSAVSVCVTISK